MYSAQNPEKSSGSPDSRGSAVSGTGEGKAVPPAGDRLEEGDEAAQWQSQVEAQSVRKRPRRRWGRAVALTVLAAILATVVVRTFFVDVYTVTQTSMQPTLDDSERILVDKRYPGDSGPKAGDIVVFDGTGSFTPYEQQGSTLEEALIRMGHWVGIGSPPSTYVKRVIGAEGDTVACCDDDGALLVNDQPLMEPYLDQEVTASSPASDLEFEVEVPPGRIWVMGDHREESIDSRDLLGAPGGGMISEERIIGRATTVFWPPGQSRGLESEQPQTTTGGQPQ